MTSGTWADQLVFRWDADNRSGNTGFGLVAWSGDPERAEKVSRGAARKLQVAGDEAAPGLVRIGVGRTRESVLLVRRVLGHDPGGRPGTLCHALLASDTELNVETCLGLHRWSWEGSDLPLNEVRGELRRLPTRVLLQASMPEREDLSRFLPGVARSLTAATAEALRHPGSRYTFLDRTGGDLPYRVLWGLHGILGELRAKHPLGWSFATHDTDDSEKFRFVFVPRWPASASHDERRVRADLEQPREDPALTLAADLVHHHLESLSQRGDGPSRAATALADAAGDMGWLEPGDALLAAAERAVRHLGSTAPSFRPGPRHRRETYPDVPVWRDEMAPAPEPAPAAPPPEARPASEDEELLHALRDDLPFEETERVLRQIRPRFEHWPPALQAELGRIALEKTLCGGSRADAGGRHPAAHWTSGPSRSVRPVPEQEVRLRRPSTDHGPVTRTVLPEDRPELPDAAPDHQLRAIMMMFGAVLVVLIVAIVALTAL